MSEKPCIHFRDPNAWVITNMEDKGNERVLHRLCRACGTTQTKIVRKNGVEQNPRTQPWIGVRKKSGYAGEGQI